MAAYALRRVAAGILLIAVVSALVFAGTQILPGDAASAILGPTATPSRFGSAPAARPRPARRRSVLALGDRSHARRSGSLDDGADLGHVVHLIARDEHPDFASVTLALCIPLSIILGTLAALKRNRWLDYAISYLTLGVIALPEFVTGPLLILALAIDVSLFPPVSLVSPGHNPLATPSLLVLPVLTLLLSLLAYSVRMVRAGVADVLASEFVQSAQLNGASQVRICSGMCYPCHRAERSGVRAHRAVAPGRHHRRRDGLQYAGLGQGLVQAVSAPTSRSCRRSPC